MSTTYNSQKNASSHKSAWILAAAVLVAGGAFLMLAEEAEGSHYWAGTLQWNHTPVKSLTEDQLGVPVEGTENVAFFSGRQAWRSSALLAGPGGIAGQQVPLLNGVQCLITTGEGLLYFSDGGSEQFMRLITYVDEVRDRAVVKLVRAGALGPEVCQTNLSYVVDIPHAFPDKTDQGNDWEVSWYSCCRIGYGYNGNYHVNNHDTYEQLWTHLNLLLPNQSPIVWLQPLRYCPVDDNCTFRLDVNDYDEDQLSYRFASSPEANRNGPFHQPGPDCNRCGPVEFYSKVHPISGEISWQTDGADIVPACSNPASPSCTQRNLYTMHIMVSDGFTHVPVEFMIELVDTSSLVCEDGSPIQVDPDTGETYCSEVNCDSPGMAETPGCQSPPRPTPGPDPERERPIDDPIWYVPEAPPQAPWQDPAVANARAIDYVYNDYVDDEIANKDTDGDGVRDRDDLCPGNPMTTVQDIDLDGIGDGCDADRDGDGIANGADPCPNDPKNSCAQAEKAELEATTTAEQQRGTIDTADSKPVARESASVAVTHEAEKASSTGWIVLAFVGAAMAVLLLAMLTRRK